MAPPLQQAIADKLEYNYATLAIITAVGYDYMLTFPKEIEYIWNRSWSWVSTLFILARYFGLCFSILTSIFGSTFFPGPNIMYVFNVYPPSPNTVRYVQETKRAQTGVSQVVDDFFQMSFCIFVGAAELVMILRVWALYNRSKLVLYAILAIYVLEQVSLLAGTVVFVAKVGSSAIATDIGVQFSSCEQTEFPTIPIWLEYSPMCLGLTLSVLMYLLTTIQLIKELLQMYRATKRVKLNRYMKCLVMEGMIYFAIVVTFLMATTLYDTISATGDQLLLLLDTTLQTVPLVTLVPRFVLNLREIYARDLQGRRGSNVDTGFGLGSGFEQGVVRSVVAFADLEENGSDGRDDETEMEIQQVTHTNIV